MKIEITKEQKIENNVPNEPTYTIYLSRNRYFADIIIGLSKQELIRLSDEIKSQLETLK